MIILAMLSIGAGSAIFTWLICGAIHAKEKRELGEGWAEERKGMRLVIDASCAAINQLEWRLELAKRRDARGGAA